MRHSPSSCRRGSARRYRALGGAAPSGALRLQRRPGRGRGAVLQPLPSPGPAGVRCVPGGKGEGSPGWAGGTARGPRPAARWDRPAARGWGAAAPSPLFAGAGLGWVRPAALVRGWTGPAGERRYRGGKAAVSRSVRPQQPLSLCISGVFLQLWPCWGLSPCQEALGINIAGRVVMSVVQTKWRQKGSR